MTDTAYKLNKEDCAALRKAGAVSFHYRTEASGAKAYINASKETGIGSNNESKWEVKIPMRNKATLYMGDSCASWEHELETAFEYIGSAQYHETWVTVANLIKPGDSLIAHWIADGMRNENMKRADMHGDQLVLIVERNDRRMHFNIGSCICPDHSSARMCKIRQKRAVA